jgi:hypothetical protein
MKPYFYFAHRNMISLLLYLIMAVLLIPSSCKQKGDDPEPISNVQLAKLSKTWKLKNITLNGISKLAEYPSFQLTLAGTKGADLFTYTTSARPLLSPWPASGSWAFGGDVATQITRDPKTKDALEMTYSVNTSALQLNFNFTGTGYAGRVSEITGQWVFTFE